MKIIQLARVNQHRCKANCPFPLFIEISLLALQEQNIFSLEQITCFEHKSEENHLNRSKKLIMNPAVSILAEIPEELHSSLKNYLETHPQWDQDQFLLPPCLFFITKQRRTD